jgi:hypothetical protein
MSIPHFMKISHLVKDIWHIYAKENKKCRLKVLIFSLYFVATENSVHSTVLLQESCKHNSPLFIYTIT